MTAPTVHYGDEVITIDGRFRAIQHKLDRLGTQVNILSVVMLLHLSGIDLAVGSNLMKLLHLV